MEKILILDFGSQYTHLITNRIRRLGVFSEIVNPDSDINFDDNNIKGIILSGGPNSVYDKKRPPFNENIFTKIKNRDINIPILGICYGHQLLSYELGGSVKQGEVREYGKADIEITKKESKLLKNLDKYETVWMSHGDEVDKLPEGFEIVASTPNCKTAVIENRNLNIYGIQFHPEVTHSVNGIKILENFINICNIQKNWSMELYLEQLKIDLKKQVGNKKVFLLVSGGVDSTVAFALLKSILGDEKVLGVHIDNGLMRLNETSIINDFMRENNFSNLHIEDLSKEFISALKEKYSPEEKRKIIGRLFIELKDGIFEKLGINQDDYLLAQGTIYPDTIESGDTKNSSVIKTHHNRVDIVQKLIAEGKIIEPLKELYKDEVRELGELLGIPKELVWRHPFPGPGLGVRTLCNEEEIKIDDNENRQIVQFAQKYGYNATILPVKSVGVQGDFRTYSHPVAIWGGEKNWNKLEELSIELTNRFSFINRVVYTFFPNNIEKVNSVLAYITDERLDVLRKVDDIATKTIIKNNLYDKIWQMPVILLPLSINGSKKESIVLRPVESAEAMTAKFYKIDFNIIEEFVKEAQKEEISAIFYDLTHKPPGTIEWE